MTNGWTEKRTNGCMVKQIYGQERAMISGRMDEWTDRQNVYERGKKVKVYERGNVYENDNIYERELGQNFILSNLIYNKTILIL